MPQELTSDLATWFAPVSVEEFHRDYWLKRPLVSHSSCPGERLAWLEQLIGPFDLASLLERAQGEVSVWYADGAYRTDLKVAPAIARKLYGAGFTLHFHFDSARVGEGRLLNGVCEQLGQTTARFALHSIFATRCGKTTPVHVDERENFTVQLTGRKRWRVGYNPKWEFPLAEWQPGMRPGEIMPSDAETFELLPGSVLYLPGPWAHTTEDLGDSLSMNVSLKVQTWFDVLWPIVARYLSVNCGWDEPVGRLVTPDGVVPDEVITRLKERLADLSRIPFSEIPIFTAESTDDASGPIRCRRNPLVRASLRPRGDGFAVHLQGPTPEAPVWDVPQNLLAIYRWIARSAEPFSFADLRTQFSDSDAGVVHEIFQRLLDAGFLLVVE